jgi:hypothetical protein
VNDVGLRLRHRLVRRAARSEAVAVLAECRVPQRLKSLQRCLLDHTVDYGWNAEVARPAGRIRDLNPTHRLRLVAALKQLAFNLLPARLQDARQASDGYPIDARGALVAHHSTHGWSGLLRPLLTSAARSGGLATTPVPCGTRGRSRGVSPAAFLARPPDWPRRTWSPCWVPCASWRSTP